MIYIFLIAVSLAMDAFAVSVSSGLSVKGFKLRHALLMGAYFGTFQFIMPLIGWFLGNTVAKFVMGVSPWISFVLLAAIGGKMIFDTLHEKEGETDTITELTHGRLFVFAVATSIDALAVGVSFAFMSVNIWASSAVIGVVAFGLSVLGGLIGKRIGERFRDRAGLFGGIVLVLIGIKILLEGIL